MGKTGKRGKRPAVAKTAGDAAAWLGVNVRTVQKWHKLPGFPGKPSEPGKKNGRYPLARIETWRDKNLGKQNRQDLTAKQGDAYQDARQRKEIAAALIKEVEAKKLLGNVIDADDVDRLHQRVVATVVAQLEELGDMVIAKLPADIGSEVRKSLNRDVARVISDCCDTIGELITGDSDEI